MHVRRYSGAARHSKQHSSGRNLQAIWHVSPALIAGAILAALIAAAAAYAEDTPITLRLSTVTGPSMPNSQTLIHFKERVEADSGGRIQVQIFFSSSLFTDIQNGPAVTAGKAEMAYVLLHRYSDVAPIAEALQLPFLFNTSALENAATAPDSEIRAMIDAALLTRANSRPLWWIPLGQTVLLAKGTSFANPEAAAGKVIRTYSPLTENIVKGCGGQPKDVESSDQEKVYGNGEVDAGMTGIVVVVGRKLWRFMDTLTRTNLASMQSVVVINEPFWQRLSAQDQAIIKAAAQAADAEAHAIATRMDTSAYQELASNGMKIVDLNNDELQAWRICSSDVLQDFIARSGTDGHELMVAYGRMMARLHGGGLGHRPAIANK
jgi:C4-dicarboxylate-binding protein DctP